ncbi:MAG: rRNA pseudouridine synthase [Chloroflexi bacterium]|nr:rRNA pseudouridine synthase [Chloroflexota bacterium]
MKERVQKLMAQAGVASRRESEELIKQGRVKVNGSVIHLGDQADPAADIIEVDGEKLAFAARHTYIAFYKPKNVLSTDKPHAGDERRTIYDFVPFEGRLFPIGRLDADSEGLMVLTDDGDLANRLAHPRYQHQKTYKVVVYGLPSAETIQHWSKGVLLEDEETGERFMTAPCSVQIMDGGKETTLRIVMSEGKKRQIRRVASVLGHPVKSLTRTHIGRLGLGTLRPGEWHELTPKDVEALKARSPEWLRPAAPDKTRGGPARKPQTPQKPQGRSRPSNRRNTGRRKI